MLRILVLKTFDSFWFWVRDYKTNHWDSGTNGQSYEVRYSDDNSTYTAVNGSQTLSGHPNPIYFEDLGSDLTHRYWRFYIWTTTPAPTMNIEIGGMWFGKKYELTSGNQFPEDDTTIYHNKKTTAAGGRTFVRGINSNNQTQFSRTYLINGTTDINSLQTVFEASMGSCYPLLLREGASQSDFQLVRFADSKFSKNEIEYQIYNPTVKFETIPFIPDGVSY